MAFIIFFFFFLKKFEKVEKTEIISTKFSLRCTPSVILGANLNLFKQHTGLFGPSMMDYPETYRKPPETRRGVYGFFLMPLRLAQQLNEVKYLFIIHDHLKIHVFQRTLGDHPYITSVYSRLFPTQPLYFSIDSTNRWQK